MRRALLLASLTCALACSGPPGGRRLVDGGRFELPDSGFTYDARTFATLDATPGDTGPFVCSGGCPDGSVCGCRDLRTRECGCHAPGSYNAVCDPQSEGSCRWPYECVLGRRVDGPKYICSDGREGSSCSRNENVCRTANGCVCLSTPLGSACSCQGVAGPNPLLCDPQVPATCPGGVCVRVGSSGTGFTHICSQGARYEPCELGDQTCRTSLGCVCPIFEGRPVCQCAEPGEENGEPCDPRVPETCAAPLECALVPSESPGVVSSQCRGQSTPDGGPDPLACDPMRPFCPMDFRCDEVRPGVYRCVPER